MLEEQEFLQAARLDRATLEVWIEETWLAPAASAGVRIFTDADLARARLIADLKQDMGVNDQGVGIVLHLLDQMHGLRQALAQVLQLNSRTTV